MRAVLRFLKDECGPTSVEYAVMLALIVLVAFGAIALAGQSNLINWDANIKSGMDTI